MHNIIFNTDAQEKITVEKLLTDATTSPFFGSAFSLINFTLLATDTRQRTKIELAKVFLAPKHVSVFVKV